MVEGERVGWLSRDGAEMQGTLERACWIGICGQELSVIVTCNARYFIPCERVWSVQSVQDARDGFTLVPDQLLARVAIPNGLERPAASPEWGYDHETGGAGVAAGGTAP
jgi:hypothetical protein